MVKAIRKLSLIQKNHDRDCDWNHLGFLGARMDLHQRSW